MTIDLNRLKSMTKDELIDVARQVNAPFHVNNKNETLVENIINHVMQSSLNKPAQKKKNESEDEDEEPTFLTEDELEAAFARIKERAPYFSTVYDHEAHCVTMSYINGRYKHSETMNLSCSLPKFIRKATEIARGPLILQDAEGDWEKLGGNKPHSAYASTVLRG